MGFKWEKIRLRPSLGPSGATAQGGRGGKKEEAAFHREQDAASSPCPHVFSPTADVPRSPRHQDSPHPKISAAPITLDWCFSEG